MAVYQEVTRIEQSATPPRKRSRSIPRGWAIAFRVFVSMNIAALLFVALLTVSHTEYAFILLPVLLSLFINGSRPYNFDIFRNSTPLYLLLTTCLAIVYYSFVTAFVLLTHPGTTTAHIVYVTTAFAWAVILEPVRMNIQLRIERRFNVRNRKALAAVHAFTATLPEEIDLEQLREHFLNLIQHIMQPYAVSLWTLVVEQREEQTNEQNAGEITIESDDPIIAYAISHPGLTELGRLQLDSPVVKYLKARGMELALLLVSQGELIGLLALGLRLHGQEYTSEDRTLLATLASQVAPALHVAQMVLEQQQQVREHERIAQELRTAQAIQHAFLPKDIPSLPTWQLVPYYQPVREVGGDFYDFFLFADGQLGIIIGDVTGKGIPAALVMATVHTMLRSTVQATLSPAEVLARVNNLLAKDIPSGMFVTCFYAILNPANGHVRYANAGHEPPYRYHHGNAVELWASGMPLGLLPGTVYEEYEATLVAGETLLFYSDGLVEAHAPDGEMFGFPRLQQLLTAYDGNGPLITLLLEELKRFTGKEWEQEDDVTLVTLHSLNGSEEQAKTGSQEAFELLQEARIASIGGNERGAMEWVAEAVEPLHLSKQQRDNLKTAVAEAVMNAMEHSHHYVPDKEVALQVRASDTAVAVRIRDAGDGETYPIVEPVRPNIDAKLMEEQTPRGWGLFLMKNLVDELHITNGRHFHLVELVVQRKEVSDSATNNEQHNA